MRDSRSMPFSSAFDSTAAPDQPVVDIYRFHLFFRDVDGNRFLIVHPA